MMQGDAYGLTFSIKREETVVVPDLVEDVEIVIGPLRGTYSGGRVQYEDEKWIFPVSQEETFTLLAAPHDVQVRVKFVGGDVLGQEIPHLYVERSLSKEVL